MSDTASQYDDRLTPDQREWVERGLDKRRVLVKLRDRALNEFFPDGIRHGPHWAAMPEGYVVKKLYFYDEHIHVLVWHPSFAWVEEGAMIPEVEWSWWNDCPHALPMREASAPLAAPEYWTAGPGTFAQLKEPEPLAFVVGQRVEVHGIGPKGWPELNGRRGRVTRRHGASDYRVLLDGDDPLNGVMLYSKDVLRAVAEDEPMRLSLNGEPLAESRMGSDDKLSVEVVNEAQAEKLRAIWEECSAAPEPPAVEPTAIRWREFL